MGEARLRLRERRPFVGRDVERGELAPARVEQIALRHERFRGGGRGIALLDRGTPRPPCRADFAREDREAAEGVDQRALRVGGEQRLMGMLAVQVDQELADLRQLGERGRAAVDPRAALALGIERAADQQFGFAGRRVAGQPLQREPFGDVGPVVHIELGREFGPVGAGAQLSLLEAVAQQECQRIEQDRLAGARFAGEHGEAAIELEVEGLDDDEIPDRQEAQHGVSAVPWRGDARSAGQPSRSGVSPQWSFSRSMAK